MITLAVIKGLVGCKFLISSSYDSYTEASHNDFVNDNLTSPGKQDNKNPLKIKYADNPCDLSDLSELTTKFVNIPIIGNIQISIV